MQESNVAVTLDAPHFPRFIGPRIRFDNNTKFTGSTPLFHAVLFLSIQSQAMNNILRRFSPTASVAVAAVAWYHRPFASASEAPVGESTTTTTTDSFASNSRIISTSAPQPPRFANSPTSSSSAGSKLLFLGSGSSTGCPKPLCSLLFPEQGVGTSDRSRNPDWTDTLRQDQLAYASACRTSRLAMQGDPRNNKNYRNNPSLLIQFVEPVNRDTSVRRNVVIDVGKTFRETAIRWMPRYAIQSLDAVLLTHHHMDAVAGLDDLRGFQRTAPPLKTSHDSATTTRDVASPPIRIPIPIYASHECWDQVAKQFPWLVPNYAKTRTSPDVMGIDKGIDKKGHRSLTALPVWHGDDLICLGFAFSLPLSLDNDNEKRDETNATTAAPTKNIVYLSDISRMKEETLHYIQTQLPPTDIFIVDTLLMDDKIHPVHFNLRQAVALAKELGAKKTLLVGMSCDSFPPHDEMNAYLQEHYKDLGHFFGVRRVIVGVLKKGKYL
ncbi:Metallo-beta-lactamase superfamily [Fragilaria crotonensis]|nr:Metallo-beta-lactamase superfamily [Fragilaria crotonensis]